MSGFLARLKSAIPESVKRPIWYVTDREYRQTYRQQQQKIRRLKALQADAWKQIFPQTDGTVLSGPFRGIRFPVDFCSPQKLLGTYEKELWGVFEQVATRDYNLVVDVGAAEGFYVAGLSALIDRSPMIAFEADPRLHPKIREIAELNHTIDRVTIQGLCGPCDLEQALSPARRPLVLCDIEGAEQEVLNPQTVPGLLNADVIVEVHDAIRPGLTELLTERFQNSHALSLIVSRDRQHDDFPSTIEIDDELILPSMEESRGGRMNWLWMQSTQNRAAG